ncbi:MAG: hypothetical protein ACRDPR_04410 [Nocardioidaceae bacterium]
MSERDPNGAGRLRLEFCGEWVDIPGERPFAIGRGGDFEVDDNPYLHRRFLEIYSRDGLWWLANVGGQLAATMFDADSRVQAWLFPGARLPIVFPVTLVCFTAGPTGYELALHLDAPPFSAPPTADLPDDGHTTLGRVTLTEEQRLLVVALAEPALRRPGTGTSALPSSAAGAARLGWPLTKFNRKLDNLCQKLKKAGVRGLHGDPDSLASGRRARLVEYALSARLVTVDDLEDLDAAASRATF